MSSWKAEAKSTLAVIDSSTISALAGVARAISVITRGMEMGRRDQAFS